MTTADDSSSRNGNDVDAGDDVLGVVGVGYVGLTTGACLAALGHRVVCGDIDAERIERLRAGVIPIVEEGLAPLVAEGIASGRLTFVVGAAEVARQASIVFLCVPTPQDDDGSADLSYVQAAAAEIAPVLAAGSVVVNKSTVPVGSTHVVSAVLRRGDVAVVSNPEFLREGTAVHDFLHPDRVVVGSADRAAAHRVADLYRSLDTRVLVTDAASAETIKYAANGFLAMKISFVNAVAAMCEAVGADVADVVEGIGSDHRIGREFLRPGPGWGGSCFPKDSRALVHVASSHGYDFALMRGVIDVNEEQRKRMVRKVCVAAGADDLHGVTVAVLGLTFKAGTDDLRDSPALAVIGELVGIGAAVRGYDPTCVGELSPGRARDLVHVERCASAVEAARDADVVVIATEWPEFSGVDIAAVATAMRGRALVDMRNLLDPSAVRAAGLTYDGVGRS
ncbi:MAG: UDP-glucose/GDP-mannose dehydrogenase family protein [Actinomycetota bacterium]|nr:UDP-glucose/GDP-mannose dehydrogenase family protein [Actinomycetota bacterium]